MNRTARAALLATAVCVGVASGCASDPADVPDPTLNWQPVVVESFRDSWDEWVSATACGGTTTAVAPDMPGSSGDTGVKVEKLSPFEHATFESEHFAVSGDGLDEPRARSIAENLEAAWSGFEKRWKQDVPARVRVRLTRDLEKYEGSFDAASGTILLRDGERAASLELLAHEGFHAFEAAALPPLPAWMSEGLACREAATTIGGTLATSEALPAFRQIFERQRPTSRTYVWRDARPLRETLVASYAEFHARGLRYNGRTWAEHRNYVIAWSLTELAQRDPTSAAAKILAATMAKTKAGMEPERAAREAVSAFSDAQLESEWLHYAAHELHGAPATDPTVLRFLGAPEPRKPAPTPPSYPDARKALDARRLRSIEETKAAEAIAESARGAELAECAKALEAIYEHGAPRVAEHFALESGIVNFDAVASLASVATVHATFRSESGRGEVELRVERLAGHEGPLAVAFPPGSFARADLSKDPGRYLDVRWFEQRPQELAFLRGRVVALAADESLKSVRVPVACNNIWRSPPQQGQPLTLVRFEAGSPQERLMNVACAGEKPRTPDMQLALWATSGELRWRELAADLPALRTFAGEPIQQAQVDRLAETLLDAAIDPADVRVFGPRLSASPSPASRPAPAPAPVSCAR